MEHPTAAAATRTSFHPHTGLFNFQVTLDTTDLEISKMKQQLAGYLTYGKVPDLVGLTKAAQKLIEDQLEAILAEKDLSNTEFAFVSGVQVQGSGAGTGVAQ